MNSFRPRRFLPRPRLLGLTLASALPLVLSVSSDAQQDAGASGGLSAPLGGGAGAAGVEALDAGKVAEEGDHDLQQAAREYQAVIASYDALRPRAAEALFRLGEIAAKLQQHDEARSLYSRVVAEFSGMGDTVLRSQERLAGLGAGLGGSPGGAGRIQTNTVVYVQLEEGAAGSVAAMDPVLAQRYGLQPVAGPQGMSPAMAARYGLTVGGPATAAGGAGLESGTLVRVPAPTADPTAPGGSGLGGGAGMAPGAFATAAPVASPYTVNLTGGSTDKAATLRAEAAQIAAQLRKLRRERRALENPDLRHMPMALVEDPQVIKLMESCDQARLHRIMFEASLIGPDGKRRALDEIGVQNAQRRMEAEQNAQRILTSYLSETCLPRMQRAEQLLTEELDQLEQEISKATPKF